MKHAPFFLLLSFFLFAANLLGQANKFPINLRTHLSDLVVEGKVVSTKGFGGEGGSAIYTSNIIEVSKVFKGAIQGNKVEIITLGGRVGQKVGLVSHGHTFEVGTKGIFFCRKASNTQYPSLAQTPNPHYSITGVEGGFIAFFHDYANPKAADIFAAYNDIPKDIYEKIILTAREPVKLLDGNSTSQDMNTPDSPDDQVAISYTFENVYLSADLSRVTFDVYAKCSENGIRFGKSKIYIQYSSQVFGSNIATSGALTIGKGTIIQNSAYSITTENQTSEKVEIDITSNFSSLTDSYAMTTLPEQLCHVELEIQDFGALANIGFDAFQMSGQSWYYDPSTDRYILFDRVEVENPIEGVASENSVGITYTIENTTVTGNDPQYLEFDVMVKAHAPGTKLALAHYILEYNIDAFGQNINGAGNVTITHGDLLSTYNNSIVDVVDSDDGGNNLGVTYAYAGIDIVELPTDPKRLSHLKIEIQNCEKKANIGFDVPNMLWQNPNAYYDSALFPYVFYDPVVATDKYDQYLCSENEPIIYDFYPKSIPAGIGDSITVVGKNFGESGSLSFTSVNSKNAGMEIFVEAYQEDNIFWSDTLIRYFVTSDLKKNTGQNTPAATGRIKVVAESAMFVMSDDTLEVPFAVINTRGDDSIAYRLNMVNGNGLGGYSFYVDSEFDSLGATDCIRDAICQWNQSTMANWIYAGVESYDTISDNQRNQIIWSDAFSTAAAITSTTANLDICDDFWLVDDIDMFVFNPFYSFVMMGDTFEHTGNFNCDIPPSDLESDIQSIILHEIGHVHFLDHVASNSKVMYPSITSGSERSVLHADDINGGVNVVDYSVNNWPVGCDYSQLVPEITCTNGIHEASNSTLALRVFPNPTSGFTSISLTGDLEFGKANVENISLCGVIISRQSIDITDTSIHLALDSTIPPGIYVISINNASQRWMGRFVKI
ncbi:MAG: matrixin family metalloprotease [Saprospiraceae bacterium]|nr:matrixin family metalloprotease [Saprospiraceae bacterium]